MVLEGAQGPEALPATLTCAAPCTQGLSMDWWHGARNAVWWPRASKPERSAAHTRLDASVRRQGRLDASVRRHGRLDASIAPFRLTEPPPLGMGNGAVWGREDKGGEGHVP